MAFYGAFFAMAAADDQVQREELELIYGTLDTESLSEEAGRRLYAYIVDPQLCKIASKLSETLPSPSATVSCSTSWK